MVSRYRWVILSLAFLSFMASITPRTVYSPLIPEITVALNLTHTEAGILMSGFMIGYLAMQLPVGVISDKIGVKRVFIVSMTLGGIICILTGFATSFTDFLAYRFANGLAAGCFFAPGSALVLRWFPPKDRAIAIGFFEISVTIGNVIGLGLSAAVSSMFGGWRWPFWFFGIPSLIVAMFLPFLLKEKPEDGFDGDMVGGGGSVGLYYGIILRDSRFWFLCLAAFGGCAILLGSLTWIPTYLVRFVGLTEVYAGVVSSLIVLTSIFATPLGGFVADRILKRRSPIIFVGAFGSGLVCVLFSFLMPTELYPAAVLFVTIIFFCNILWIAASLLSEWFPLYVMGTTSGFLNFVTIIGGVIGPFIFGFVLDLTGSFSLGWLVLGFIAAVSALPMLMVMLKESRRISMK